MTGSDDGANEHFRSQPTPQETAVSAPNFVPLYVTDPALRHDWAAQGLTIAPGASA